MVAMVVAFQIPEVIVPMAVKLDSLVMVVVATQDGLPVPKANCRILPSVEEARVVIVPTGLKNGIEPEVTADQSWPVPPY